MFLFSDIFTIADAHIINHAASYSKNGAGRKIWFYSYIKNQTFNAWKSSISENQISIYDTDDVTLNFCALSFQYCTPNMKNLSWNASLFLSELSMLPNHMFKNNLYLDTWRLHYDTTLFCTKTMLTF